jgi:hypothetical protein
MRSMMRTHLDHASIRDYDAVHHYILEMADALSAGIVAQFPGRLRVQQCRPAPKVLPGWTGRRRPRERSDALAGPKGQRRTSALASHARRIQTKEVTNRKSIPVAVDGDDEHRS